MKNYDAEQTYIVSNNCHFQLVIVAVAVISGQKLSIKHYIHLAVDYITGVG